MFLEFFKIFGKFIILALMLPFVLIRLAIIKTVKKININIKKAYCKLMHKKYYDMNIIVTSIGSVSNYKCRKCDL